MDPNDRDREAREGARDDAREGLLPQAEGAEVGEDETDLQWHERVGDDLKERPS